MIEICFATNNQNKLQEVWHMTSPDFRILSLLEIGCNEDLSETQNTLEGNSRQKAEFVFNKYNIPCFADDSGLEVEALKGAPGVFSARYAGDHKNNDDNINLLLKNLSGIKNRKARFRTIITLVGLGDRHFFEGIIEGEIIFEKRGSKGFGYDPIFQPLGYTETFAEMGIAKKNQFSHRAIAIQKLITFLKNYR